MKIVHLVPFETLERLRVAADLPVTRWADLIGLRARDYSATQKSETLSITEDNLNQLADNLGLDVQAIRSGTVDYRALARLQAGETLSIPEYLQVAARSKVRTSAHLLDLVEHQFGWRERSRILNSLQVSESFVANPENVINIRFIQKVCESIHELGVGPEKFQALGGYSVARNYHSPLGDLYRAFSSVREALESTFTDIIQVYFDQNYLYRIRRSSHGRIEIEARCNPEVLDGLSEKKLGNRLTCAARSGTFATLTGYFRLPHAKVSHPHCMHLGDPVCLHIIDYTSALQKEKHRPRERAQDRTL